MSDIFLNATTGGGGQVSYTYLNTWFNTLGATPLATPNKLCLRNATGGASFGDVSANRIIINASGNQEPLINLIDATGNTGYEIKTDLNGNVPNLYILNSNNSGHTHLQSKNTIYLNSRFGVNQKTASFDPSGIFRTPILQMTDGIVNLENANAKLVSLKNEILSPNYDSLELTNTNTSGKINLTASVITTSGRLVVNAPSGTAQAQFGTSLDTFTINNLSGISLSVYGNPTTSSTFNFGVDNNNLTSNFNLITGGLVRMFVSNSGNIGIGTNNPQSILDVNGSINTSGLTAINISCNNINVSGTTRLNIGQYNIGLQPIRAWWLITGSGYNVSKTTGQAGYFNEASFYQLDISSNPSGVQSYNIFTDPTDGQWYQLGNNTSNRIAEQLRDYITYWLRLAPVGTCFNFICKQGGDGDGTLFTANKCGSTGGNPNIVIQGWADGSRLTYRNFRTTWSGFNANLSAAYVW